MKSKHTKTSARDGQDSHVPVNNFNLQELTRYGDTQNNTSTHTYSEPPQQNNPSSVIMPMADGTSLLRVMEGEIQRLRKYQATAGAHDALKSEIELTQGTSDPLSASHERGGEDQAANALASQNNHEIKRVDDSATPEGDGRNQYNFSGKCKKEAESVPSSGFAKAEAAAYWVERPFDIGTATPDRPFLLKPREKNFESTGTLTAVARAPSKTSVDPRVKLTLRLFKVPDRHNQEFSSDRHISLNTSIKVLQLHLQEECLLIAEEHRLRLALLAQAHHQCFHFRACPELTVDSSRNFYITNDDQSECRFERVRDLYHIHQIEGAARDGVPLSLRFLVEMGESYQPVEGYGGPITTYSDFRPEIGLWSSRWEQEEQDVKIGLMTSAVYNVPERNHIEIYKNLTGTSGSDVLGTDEQKEKFDSIISQIPERESKLRQPLMTFHRYDPTSTLNPSSPPTAIYLAIRFFSHLNSVGLTGFDPPAAVLLKIPADRTADKTKRALIQELQLYCSGQTLPQPRASYKSAFRELLRDNVRVKWNLQVWCMPQGGQRKRMHICRKKELFTDFLVEGGGDGLYVEAHFVPSEDMVKQMFGVKVEI